MSHVWHILIKHYKIVLLGLIVLMGISIYFITKIEVDNSLKIWFLEDDPVYERYHAFQNRYGNDELMSAVLVYDKTVWDAKAIADMMEAESALKKVKGVADVYTFASAPFIVKTMLGAKQKPILSIPPTTVEEVEGLQMRLENTPIIKSTFISKNEKAFSILIRLEKREVIDAYSGKVIIDIRSALNGVYKDNYKLGGLAVINDALNLAVSKESFIFSVISFLVVGLLLFIYLKSFAFAFISLFSVAIPVLFVLALFAISGHKINLVSMIIPSVLLVTGIGTSIHIINIFRQMRLTYPDETKYDLLQRTLKYSFIPNFFNTATTMAGFISIYFTPVAAVKTTGLFAGIGVGIMFIVAFILTGCGIAAISDRISMKPYTDHGAANRFNERMVGWMSTFATKYRKQVIIIFLFAIISCLCLIPKVEVNTYPIEYLSHKFKVRQDHDVISKVMGNYLPYELIVKSDIPIDNLEKFTALETFQKRLQADHRIAQPISMVDVVKYLDTKLYGNGVDFKLPANEEKFQRILAQYKSSKESKIMDLGNRDLREIRITGRVPVTSSRDYREIIEYSQKAFKETIPASFKMELVPQGYTPMYVAMNHYVTSSQLQSFFVAFFLIFILAVICFRNLSITILSVLPNLFPIAIAIGYMVLFKIPLDNGTAMISSIILGIAFNDTIHLIYAFLNIRKEGVSRQEAAIRSLKRVGNAITINTITLAAGYLVLSFSSIKNLQYFGVICTLAVVGAWLGNLIMLPALLSRKSIIEIDTSVESKDNQD